MMVVVPDHEALLDQVADHRAGPHTRLVPRRDRSFLDENDQLGPLLVGQLRRRSFGDRRAKALDVICFVPLQPAVHRSTRHAEIGGDIDHATPVDVRTDGAPTPPFAEVVLGLGLDDELVELPELFTSSPCPADRLAVLGLRHDRVTMILSRSIVKRGSQAARSCLVYNSSGQISEIWDTLLPTPNKVLITWDSTTNGNVSTVTDANGYRRLQFVYTTGRMTGVNFQLKTSGVWGTVHSVTYNNTGPGGLTSTTIGGQLAQQYGYDAAGNLASITDGASNTIASFYYASSTVGQVDRIATSNGTVGFEFNSVRTGCTGNTLLYFNKGNTTSCSADSDCGSGYFCGGKTGTGATGSCFLAARCLTLGTAGGETVVTNVAALGPGGGSCTGACLDVAQYIWSTVSGVVGVAGRKDPLGNYTSATYNSDGLPTQIAYGDTDSDPTNGGYARTEYFTYDTTIRGRLLGEYHPSDLNTSPCGPFGLWDAPAQQAFTTARAVC